jgi:hypothetical protein
MLVTWVLLAPLEWILYAAPEILEEEPFSVFVKALGIGGFLTGLIYVLCVTVLTVGGMAAEHWPTVILMQIVKIPGGFMTRQDGLMLSFWIFAMFIPLSGALSYTSELWGKADGTGRCRNIRLLGIAGALLAWKAESGFYSAYFWWMLISGLVLLWLCPLFLRILKNGGKTGRKRRILWIMMLTLIVTAGCTGCERYVALENRAFVMALSVDEGTEATYAFTYTFPDLEALTGNGESTKYEPVTLEADSLLKAEDKYDSMSGKSLDYGQVKVLVIGSNMIYDNEKLEKLFEEIRENPEFSRTVKVCQSLTSGREILMLDEDIPGSVGIYIEEMFENNGEHLGISTVILNDVISGYSEEDIKNLLPKIGVYDEKPRFLQ